MLVLLVSIRLMNGSMSIDILLSFAFVDDNGRTYLIFHFTTHLSVGQRHANMESLYDYGARSGFWRLHELLTRKKVPW